jgi:hypothetical protein
LACQTHVKNIGSIVRVNIDGIDIDSIPDSNVIVGSISCQSFSLTGKRKSEKDRRKKMSEKMSEKMSGENNSRSKFTNKQVEEIRYKWWNDRKEIEDLVDEYGVNCSLITRILRNETYIDPEWGKNCRKLNLRNKKRLIEVKISSKTDRVE